MKAYPDPALVNFHSVFPQSEQARVVHQAKRYALLSEDRRADEVAEAFMGQFVSPDRLDGWGPPDTGKMPIVSVSRGMSTPGHYGYQPTIAGNPDNLDAMSDVMRPLWAKKQHVEMMAWGMGCYCVRTGWSEDLQRVVWELVSPHVMWCDGHPDDPTTPITQRHLRRRMVVEPGGYEPCDRYCWDVYDISGDAPSFRIVLAGPDGSMGADVTEQLLGQTFEAELYPFVDVDGRPYLPYTMHRSHDDGTLWGWNRGRGAFRSSLFSVMYFTHSGKVARDAAYSGGIAVNMSPSGVKAKADGSQTVDFEAGDIMLFESTSERAPQFFKIDTGANIKDLAEFASNHAAQATLDMGVTPADMARSGANPMSGYAIHLTNQVKRDEQHRTQQFCRSADMETIRQTALTLRREAGLDMPVDGWSIAYREIPKSPAEAADDRKQAEWSMEHGLLSPVAYYQQQHPGTTREAALEALRSIASDRAAIQAVTPEED